MLSFIGLHPEGPCEAKRMSLGWWEPASHNGPKVLVLSPSPQVCDIGKECGQQQNGGPFENA
jgi:hypothetical protein